MGSLYPTEPIRCMHYLQVKSITKNMYKFEIQRSAEKIFIMCDSRYQEGLRCMFVLLLS